MGRGRGDNETRRTHGARESESERIKSRFFQPVSKQLTLQI